MSEADIKLLKGKLRQYPDFPSEGILFEDIVCRAAAAGCMKRSNCRTD